ncbi:MAG TPA: hypothetical protein VFT95_22100 [Micromonosporaceae bacterium]|nr:hypothetical protein [Micromonosporaceae bacterium]
MDVGIAVPQTPVAVAPGTETRIRVDLRNLSAAAVSVRLSVAHSRAGAWAQADPPVLELEAGASAHADLVFRPPSGVESGINLLPFTVQAEDLRLGVIAGRATGLLTVAPQERLTAELSREGSRAGLVTLQVRLGNRADVPLTLKLEPKLESDDCRAEPVPAVIDVPGGEMATAKVNVRPRRLSVSRKAYDLSMACRDVAAPADGPPLAVLTDSGNVPPRLGPRFTVPLVLLLLLIGLAGAGLATGRVKLPERLPFVGGGDSAPGVAQVRIAKPFVVTEVFLKGTPDGRSAADDAVARMTAAGMSVKLVDSTTSPDLADGEGGFWVVLKDGFGTVGEAQSFCDRFRAVAPKCEIFS